MIRSIVAALFFVCGSALAQDNRPNIVLLLVDDMGWRDLGCYGDSFHETPHIDQLANEGMKFSDAYATCPVCSPSRASLHTGKYPARLNITNWIPGRRFPLAPLTTPDFVQQLPLEETTLAESMRSAGYATWHVGKWHLGQKPFYPEHQGYDVNIGGHAKGGPASYFHPYRKPRPNPVVDWTVKNLPPGGRKGDYLTDRLTTEAVKLIDNHDEQKPFFLSFSWYTVHAPYEGKKTLVDKYKGKKAGNPNFSKRHAVYASMVQSLDESVGRVRDALRKKGVLDKTLIVLTSDNGGVDNVADNTPLRGGKGWLYEGGIREPLIVRWPGHVTPGSSSSEPVTGTDIHSTLLTAAGIRSTGTNSPDGVNLTPILEGKVSTLDREAIFWHYPHWHTTQRPPCSAVRAGDWKLIHFWADGRDELYNLSRDIGESTNLAARNPRKRTELRRRLIKWLDDVKAQRPEKNPRHDPKRPFASSFTDWGAGMPRALIIGDSISIGYTYRVRDILEGEVYVTRIPQNGQHTATGLAKLESWLSGQTYDVIHFNWGLWDLCWRSRDPKKAMLRDKKNGRRTHSTKEYAANMDKLVRRLKKTGARLIFATTTPVPEGEPGRVAGDAVRYNKAALKVMRRHGVEVNDLHTTIGDRMLELQTRPGDVHFKPQGSQLLAERVAAAIRSATRR